MKQKNTSLDEHILGLAPDHNWGFTYRRNLYGAFDVTEKGLLALETHLRDFVVSVSPTNKPPSEIVKVVFIGKPSEVYSSISEVMALRNPRTEKISGINIRLINSEALVSIWLDDFGLYSSQHSVVLLFAADSDKNFGKYEARVKSELKNIECWYSWGRKCLDRTRPVASKVPPILYLVLAFAGLASMMFSFFSDKARYAQWRTSTEKIVEEYNSLSISDPNFGQTLEALDPNIGVKLNDLRTAIDKYQDPGYLRLFMIVIRWLAYGFIGVLLVLLVAFLFPRIVFEIGEGKTRQEQRVWFRRFVIGSIIILPLLRKIFQWP